VQKLLQSEWAVSQIRAGFRLLETLEVIRLGELAAVPLAALVEDPCLDLEC
jgi:hypothetical protein